MILALFLDGQPNWPGRTAACSSNTSLLLDAAPRTLGQTYMWPTAGAADVEDASERAAAAVVTDMAEDGGAVRALLVERIKDGATSGTGGTA